MSHIFISYSRKDQACVDTIYNRLQAEDFPLWLDRRQIAVSSEWTKEIMKGIDHAAVFLLVWSANAKASQYVEQEMNIALNRSFGTHKSLRIITVRIDDTPYPDIFSHKQAFDVGAGCSEDKITELVEELPAELRIFSFNKPLEQQRHERVPETPLLRVAYDRELAHGFKADLVGPAAKRFPKTPEILHVGLQFTRGIKLNLIQDIYKVVGAEAAPMWTLHIMGATNTEGTEYRLPPDNAALWQSSSDYIQTIIKQIADERKTTLRIFAPIPAALLAGAMRGFERFWHVQLYHYEPALNNYILALDQPRR